MKFSELNESFNQLFKNYTEEAGKLNEATTSPEDQADSDLIRSVLDKVGNRVNARLTPEEQAVLDKYGIKRTYAKNDSGKLSVNGRYLDRDVDNRTAQRYYSKSYNNGTPSKINYADRARKFNSTRAKDNQIFTGPWSADNDEINKHGGNFNLRFDGLQDAERYAQEIPERDRVQTMTQHLNSRRRAQKRIDNADDERAKRIAKAQAEFDKAKAYADQNYEWDTVDSAKTRDFAQKNIDDMLKKVEELEELFDANINLNPGDMNIDAHELGGKNNKVSVLGGRMPESVEDDSLDESDLLEAKGVRETTNKLLELADEGIFSYEALALAALKYMSEDEVADMARANEFLLDDEYDEDLDESFLGIKSKKEKEREAKAKAEKEEQKRRDEEEVERREKARQDDVVRSWKEREKREREWERQNRNYHSSSKADTPSNTGYRGVNYSGGDYY